MSLDDDLVASLLATWRDLHQHPELAFQEARTAGIVAERLRAIGLEDVREGVAETGVTATLRGGGPGPTLLLRAEMDALPISEDTGLPYASRNDGVMHACGHDAHTAILLAVAEALARDRGELPGTVRFAFQPAEEIGAGAARMVEAGVMNDPPVAGVLALHMHAHIPTGVIGIPPRAAAASAAEIEIEIRGRGGHSAFPNELVDPVLTSAHVITALDALVAREVSPLRRAVLTIATVQAEGAFNIVPDTARLTGTIRAEDLELHERLAVRAEEITKGIASAFRCEAELTHRPFCPPVMNHPDMVAIARAAAAEVAGADRVVDAPPVMAADDLAFLTERAPGCYVFVGIAPTDGRPQVPHHNRRFAVDESSVQLGARALLVAARRFLERG
ncbi:MAG TPA: amidohydrolase [Actinomycetota bacterium]